MSHVACRRVELLAAMMGHSPFLFVIFAAVSCEKPPSFPTLLERLTAVTALHDQVQGHALGMVLLPFGTFGEVNKSCT